ncbi:uncharacterized protein [Setaria viridis]|uniref:uncharacterized protein n=1 Tax=Setaria viridis TaxID=4556 RepID=UPI003B3B784B
MKKTADGSFMPDRERDELTMALGTREHPGRCRGIGVIPWKYGFHQFIESYRSRQRSKAHQARQLRELQQQVAASEARIAQLVDERVAIALSKQASQQASAVASGPHVDVSPTQRRSSVASTEAAAGGYIEAAPGGCTEVIEERHPMDDITGRAQCELVTPAASDGFATMEVQISHQHYFRGDDIIHVPLEELFQLYNQEALDKSLISCWIFYHWVLVIIIPDQSLVTIWDSLRKPKKSFNDLMDTLNKCWTRLHQTHKCDFNEKLVLHTDFLMINMKEKLLHSEIFRRIRDQLCGFLLDEITNPAWEFYSSGSSLVPNFD